MAKAALKVLVRLLPPEITEDELVASVSELHLQHTTSRSFQAGKRYKGEAKPSINARCYFLFDSEENAEKFIKDYHGHQFVDGQGESFRAVACFAPYAKVPRQKASKDARDGTIFEDATYKEFVENLSAPKTFEAPPDPVATIQPATAKDTPLLNYMKTRAAERRARQEKRERERKRWHDRLGRIDEKPKWRCAECGTSKHLEEDPDQRGVCYCTYCWETWEAKEYKKKKKKSKAAAEDYDYEEDWYEEEPTKKKKKKKGYDDWQSSSWYAESGDWEEGWYEETVEEPKKKKKKKKKGQDEEDEYGACHWREEDYWEEGKPESHGGHSKSRRSKAKQSEEQWWEEPEASHSQSKRRSEGRWRAKEANAPKEQERPRRSRREKDSEGSQWVPKLQKH